MATGASPLAARLTKADNLLRASLIVWCSKTGPAAAGLSDRVEPCNVRGRGDVCSVARSARPALFDAFTRAVEGEFDAMYRSVHHVQWNAIAARPVWSTPGGECMNLP